MPEYRLFTFNDAGHITGPAAVIQCADDDAAIKEAKQLLDGHDIEVWQGTRIVVHLDSTLERHKG